MDQGDVLSQLRTAGLDVDSIEAFGQLVRAPVEGDRNRKRSGWYVVHELHTADGRTLFFGSFGNWKTGHTDKLKVATRGLSAEEKARIREQMERDRAAAQQARAELAETAARRAAVLWGKLPDEGRSPYLQRKRVRAFGVRFARDGAVVVPVWRPEGLAGLQFIAADGTKRFLTGTAKAGAWHWIEGRDGPLVIAEGYATGASVHMATGWPVCVAFDAGNLLPIATRLRELYADRQILLAADDDHRTPGNPGVTKATEAAQAVGGLVAVPVFSGERGTDWNDLHFAEGIDIVRAQLQAALEAPPAPPPQGTLREDRPKRAQARSVPSGRAAEPDDPWTARLRTTKDGELKPDIFNVVTILVHDPRWRGVLGYCDFSYRVVKRRKPPFSQGETGEWTDTDTTRLRVWMSEHWGATPKTGDADEAVLMAAQAARFHPVREYLDALMWDQQPRVDGWLTRYMGAVDNAYTRAVGRYWLIAAVARAMRPPVKADCVMILEGLQGLGKSTALKILGGDWYSDTHFQLGEKDGYQQMAGVWICELSELDSFNKAESTRAKQFFASQDDRYRPPYGRRAVTFPRQCVFAGTTNQDSYLKDPTGNRRYWPIGCQRLDALELERDRDQLWAEAVELYQHGHRWWPGDDEGDIFRDEQEQRFQADSWEDVLREFLVNSTTDAFTVAEIAKDALKMDPGHLKPPEEQRIGRVMARLGWVKARRRVLRGGVYVRLWVFQRPHRWTDAELAS